MKKFTGNKKGCLLSAHNSPSLILLAACLMLASTGGLAKDTKDYGDGDGNHGHGNGDAKIDYRQTNLVSDIAGIAQLQDTNLLNPWGISFSSSSPFWISDNGSGLSTLYSVTNDPGVHLHVAKLGLQVAIPGEGVPTGQLFNGTGSFHGDIFIFAGEDGTISGWRGALGFNG